MRSLGIAYVSEPWQLFAAYFVMAVGWMLASAGALTNVAGLWFFEKRGLAISLALTGASFGGIVITPLMVEAVSRWGFHNAMLGTAVATFIDSRGNDPAVRRPAAAGLSPARGRQSGLPAGETWTRARALRSLQFWTMTLPFAFGIGAQVGFLVHQLALLQPKMGLQTASYAVAVTTLMAVLGTAGRRRGDRPAQSAHCQRGVVRQPGAGAARADQHRQSGCDLRGLRRCSASPSAT